MALQAPPEGGCTLVQLPANSHLHVWLWVLPALCVQERGWEERRCLDLLLVVNLFLCICPWPANPHKVGRPQVRHPGDAALIVDFPDPLQLGFQEGSALGTNVDVVDVKDRPASGAVHMAKQSVGAGAIEWVIWSSSAASCRLLACQA
jgi:hypothetical protein